METEISLADIEALIFASEEPVSAAQLRKMVPLTPSQIAGAVEQINADLEKSGRPYEIVELAGGYRFRTRPRFGELLASAQPERKVKLSRPALDCLAVIAYRQPISRPEIEDLRSVDCGAVLRSLLERGLVRIVGRRDAPGRPALYATSPSFLETFGLRSLRDLPDLRELLAPPASEGTPVAEEGVEPRDLIGIEAAFETAPASDLEASIESEGTVAEPDADSAGQDEGEDEEEGDLEELLHALSEAADEIGEIDLEPPPAATAPEAIPPASLEPASAESEGAREEESREVAAVGEPESRQGGGGRATPEGAG